MTIHNLTDGLGRKISYLRLSLTDRCDLRCVYCMSARPQFLPKTEILTPAEIEWLVKILIERGLRKLRLTGGEPLVRRAFMDIAQKLSRLALDELTLTSNATQLPLYAKPLFALGVRRVNVSLDTLRPDLFTKLTRGGKLSKTLKGIDAALENGLHVKINLVALADINEKEIPKIIQWAHLRKMDITLIETMPIMDTGFDFTKHYLSLAKMQAKLEQQWQLTAEETVRKNSGPSRYFTVRETGGRLGFITPLSDHFCNHCNRMRVTATGKLYLCLGHNDAVDLRPALQAKKEDTLHKLLDTALAHKPAAHNFFIGKNSVSGSPNRPMAMTGG